MLDPPSVLCPTTPCCRAGACVSAVCCLQEVAALLDRGVFDNDVLLAEGWVSGLKYEDEITDDLKKRTGGKVGVLGRVWGGGKVGVKSVGCTGVGVWGVRCGKVGVWGVGWGKQWQRQWQWRQ